MASLTALLVLFSIQSSTATPALCFNTLEVVQFVNEKETASAKITWIPNPTRIVGSTVVLVSVMLVVLVMVVVFVIVVVTVLLV